MDKFVPRNAAPRVEFRGIKHTCSRALEFPQATVGLDAAGNLVSYVPESDECKRFRLFWSDVQRFGTFKPTGTLEAFFRQRQAECE